MKNMMNCTTTKKDELDLDDMKNRMNSSLSSNRLGYCTAMNLN